MAETKMERFEELLGAMNSAAEAHSLEEKRMTDEELDQVAGGYKYGMITLTKENGNVIFKMHNLNTGKVEVYSGKTQNDAMLQLVQHNFNNKEKWIVLTDPKGKVVNKFDVDAMAKELGLKRK